MDWLGIMQYRDKANAAAYEYESSPEELFKTIQEEFSKSEEAARQYRIDLIKSLNVEDQLPEGWEEHITPDHCILLPDELYIPHKEEFLNSSVIFRNWHSDKIILMSKESPV